MNWKGLKNKSDDELAKKIDELMTEVEQLGDSDDGKRITLLLKAGIVRDEEDKRRRTSELDRRTEENRKNARLAAAYITDTHKMAEEARRKADAAKPEKDYILEAIIAAALVVFLVPIWGLPENLKTWVPFVTAAVLFALVLRRRIIALLRKKGPR